MNGKETEACADFENRGSHGSEGLDGATAENGKRRGFFTPKLAEMPADTLLDEEALAGVLKVTGRTVRRMVGRRQLPPGVKLGARRIWMAGGVIEHLKREADRLAAETRRFLRGDQNKG